MEVLKTLLPTIIPLLLGGGFLTFMVERLKRRDHLADRGFQKREESVYRARFYERGFFKSDAHCRSLTQVAGAAALAYRNGKGDATEAFLEILAELLCEEREEKWCMKAFPSFLEQAREELRLEDEQENA